MDLLTLNITWARLELNLELVWHGSTRQTVGLNRYSYYEDAKILIISTG